MTGTPSLCPPAIVESLRRYVEHGTPTGSFLTAVLENNLHAAICFADPANLAALADVVAYVHWELPSVVWGSAEKRLAWLRRFGRAA